MRILAMVGHQLGAVLRHLDASARGLYPSPGADPTKLSRSRSAPVLSPEIGKAGAINRTVVILPFWDSVGSSTV